MTALRVLVGLGAALLLVGLGAVAWWSRPWRVDRSTPYGRLPRGWRPYGRATADGG